MAHKMSRVVPSQVVSFIDSTFVRHTGEVMRMNSIGAGGLSAVLDLINQIPDELPTMEDRVTNQWRRETATGSVLLPILEF